MQSSERNLLSVNISTVRITALDHEIECLVRYLRREQSLNAPGGKSSTLTARELISFQTHHLTIIAKSGIKTHPTIDKQCSAMNIVGKITGQPDHCIRHIFRRTDTPIRDEF